MSISASTYSGVPLGTTSGVTDWWYQNPGDSSFSTVVVFSVPAAADAGCYKLGALAVTRAFNPARSDGGGFAANWIYDPNWNSAPPAVSIAVIDT